METTFSSYTLAEIFRDLYLGERSGVLHLSRADVEKRIYFDRGMILYAESTQEDEDLGRRLVDEGKISPGALAEARRNISESKDLAQALVNRGLIGKEPLAFTVRYVVERIVQSVFAWEGGTARFSEGWLIQEIFESDILTTFEVILKGVYAMAGFAAVRDALAGVDGRIKLKTPTPVPVDRLALSPAHGYILSRIDGSSRVDDVLSLLPPGEEELACRFLYGLLVMGVAVIDPPPGDGPFRIGTILKDHADAVALERLQEQMILEAFESFRSRNPHEVLGLRPNPRKEDIDRAYDELKSRFGRDRLLPKVREKYRSELALIEGRSLEAYLTLSQSKHTDALRRQDESAPAAKDVGMGDLLVRVEMDKTQAKVAIEESSKQAEGYFNKARKFAREGDYHNAIQYGKLAISYAPEDARFYFLLAECQVRNPEARWQRMAEQNFAKATELDPWNAEYRITLGRFYKKRGLKLRARKQFEEVLQISPGHQAAMQELETVR